MAGNAPSTTRSNCPTASTLVTLKDAGEYIQALPPKVQQTERWQAATQALLIVVKSGDPMLAHMGMMLALYPRVSRCSTSPARKSGS